MAGLQQRHGHLALLMAVFLPLLAEGGVLLEILDERRALAEEGDPGAVLGALLGQLFQPGGVLGQGPEGAGALEGEGGGDQGHQENRGGGQGPGAAPAGRGRGGQTLGQGGPEAAEGQMEFKQLGKFGLGSGVLRPVLGLVEALETPGILQ